MTAKKKIQVYGIQQKCSCKSISDNMRTMQQSPKADMRENSTCMNETIETWYQTYSRGTGCMKHNSTMGIVTIESYSQTRMNNVTMEVRVAHWSTRLAFTFDLSGGLGKYYPGRQFDNDEECNLKKIKILERRTYEKNRSFVQKNK